MIQSLTPFRFGSLELGPNSSAELCSSAVLCSAAHRSAAHRSAAHRSATREFRPARNRHGLSSMTLVLGIVALVFSASAATAQTAAETDDEKAFYAIGASLAGQIMNLNPVSDREFDLILQGMKDAVAGRPVGDQAENRPRIRKLLQARQEAASKLERDASASFLAAVGRESGAKTTESGLIITELKAGSGASPTATDTVRVHYHGTLRDGTVFDSSVERGEPAEFPLNRVIPCWTEGVAMMKVGGKARLVCPAEIAYRNQRKGRIAPGAALDFEVELIEIVK